MVPSSSDLQLDTPIVVSDPQQLQSLTEALLPHLLPQSVLYLNGPIGAGKTTMTQYLAKAMQYNNPVTSPTFTLVHRYETPKGSLIHVDLYRLENSNAVNMLDLDQYLTLNPVIIAIEWPEHLSAEFASDWPKWTVTIDSNQDHRIIRIKKNNEFPEKEDSKGTDPPFGLRGSDDPALSSLK